MLGRINGLKTMASRLLVSLAVHKGDVQDAASISGDGVVVYCGDLESLAPIETKGSRNHYAL